MMDEADDLANGGVGVTQGRRGYRTIQSDGTFILPRHAFGVEGPIQDNVAFVAIPDPDTEGGGLMLEYLVHPVGQQIALYRVDDGSMKFLQGRQKNVREILALSVSPNKRVIAVCEKGRQPGEDPGSAQVSVYHVASFKRIRTMLFPGRADFLTCCFSGDNKWLLTIGGEPECVLVMWNWEKEKVMSTAQVHGMATRAVFNPHKHSCFTTSGPMHLRLWSTSSESVFKPHSLLPQSQEQDNFVDHTWIRGRSGQPTRMAAITDGEGVLGQSMHAHRGASVLIFDSTDVHPFLEVKQTIQVELPGSCRLETLVTFSKGFIVAGGGVNGFLSVYENMDDQRDPYMLIKNFTAKGSALGGLAVNRNSEMVYAYSKTNELLTFNLGNVDVLDEGENHFHMLLPGGNHVGAVVDMSACMMKPVVATVGADRSLRVWNFLKWKCDVVHDFRVEDPTCVSLHPTGFQVGL
ncbi:unnamed protein product, partial [Choristocarpus tenellus]